MNFESLLSHARDAYHAAFVEQVDELRRTGQQFVVELLVQPNGWTSPFPFNLTRIDFMVGKAEDPRIARLVDGLAPAAHANEYTLECGLRVTAGSLGWEAFVVSFSSVAFDIAALDGWLRRWLDVDETHVEDDHGLSGVVHGLAWDVDADRWQITADFGSAPLAAASEFLAVLAANGVESCQISPPAE